MIYTNNKQVGLSVNKDGTNLLDRALLYNRPMTLYDTDGDIAGSMRLDKDTIMFYFTKSVNEYYCNGLLFRF